MVIASPNHNLDGHFYTLDSLVSCSSLVDIKCLYTLTSNLKNRNIDIKLQEIRKLETPLGILSRGVKLLFPVFLKSLRPTNTVKDTHRSLVQFTIKRNIDTISCKVTPTT